MRICFLLLAFLVAETFANELTRCCAGGTRHFKNSNTCSSIKSEGTSMTCQRAASICCLRSLLDNACDSGTDIAKEEESCPSNINILGGGLKKECCDCCLLAKDLLNRNEPCVAPVGFSAGCLRSFNKCCNGDIEITHASEIITGRPLNDPHVLHLGDRCASSHCEHLCHDRGGEKVECSCRSGFDLAPDGMACVDRNECLTRQSPCTQSEDCVNTIGGYICQRRISRLVPHRHRANRIGNAPRRMRDDPYSRAGEYREASQANTEFGCPMGWLFQHGHCVDVDECNLGSHDCGPLYQCRNTQGSYRCDAKKCGDGELQNPMTGECTSITCPNGYYPKNGMCNDIDECVTGHNCGAGEECVNTPGSFRCQQKGNLCAHGYEVNGATGFCEDVNECTTGIAACEQKCVNIPGSYQCICDRGFALGPDGTKCEDIDECSIWAGSGNDLCMGGCINTKGSYLCQCPPGYKIQPDGRTCVDVDECAMGECAGSDKVCVNTLGSFKCHSIDCPTNYIHDSLNKNQIADGYSCIKVCSTEDTECLGNHTREVLYQFRAVPSLKTIISPIEVSRIVTHMGVPFSVDYNLDYVGQRHFRIVQERNIGIVQLVKPISGPTVETIKVNIHTKSRTGVILAFNEAIIEISVSKYPF
ncbi:Fibulin-1 [Caenorhabditis elegans]|uniref:Fibulin-1 n=1 Tax=Caenorhabditis elegans TaxID=6239 RepID=A0A061ADQ1_CAEEL|nr:Fibulin-1 [Caenorhabditis elegans]CDR32631.1 Fibulin-1 [Caenorhabditis elegans]|eukprot:NP_001293876.1 Fibulin-1 [Caenorhabditis elegans]